MLVDTHAHINDPELAGDLPGILDRAEAAGVRCIICVGYDLPNSERALQLAESDPRVFATVGLHPNSVSDAPSDWKSRLSTLAQHPRVVAIGETGLDYYRDWTTPALQREALEWQLGLADELELPIIIHNRDSDVDVENALLKWAERRSSTCAPGVLHSFAGSLTMMESCVGAGFAISFSGMVTFSNKSLHHVAEAARMVPEELMLVETDAPYLAPAPLRGRRNEPSFVRHTATRIADLRGVPVELIERATTANAKRCFPRLEVTADA